MKRTILAALVGVLVSGSVMAAEDFTGFPWGTDCKKVISKYEPYKANLFSKIYRLELYGVPVQLGIDCKGSGWFSDGRLSGAAYNDPTGANEKIILLCNKLIAANNAIYGNRTVLDLGNKVFHKWENTRTKVFLSCAENGRFQFIEYDSKAFQ